MLQNGRNFNTFPNIRHPKTCKIDIDIAKTLVYDCALKYSGALNELNRERRGIRRQALCCDRGQHLHHATVRHKTEWEGAVIRVIRKSEDLPECRNETLSGIRSFIGFGIKKGHPRIKILWPGDFFSLGLYLSHCGI